MVKKYWHLYLESLKVLTNSLRVCKLLFFIYNITGYFCGRYLDSIMRKLNTLTLLLLLLTLGSCSTEPQADDKIVPQSKPQVTIGMSSTIAMRTTADEQGRATWASGDTFALWATNSYGASVLQGAHFEMSYYLASRDMACFTSWTTPLAEGTYTYYASSPAPSSYTHREATYIIPAAQQGGTFNGAYDVMVATPCTSQALSSEQLNDLDLEFSHKMHVLKMTIPEGSNPFPTAISQVVFTFPTGVTGEVKVDVTDASAAPTIGQTDKRLVVNIPGGFDEGESAWATILPVTISGEVSYYVVSAAGQQTREKKFSISKKCQEGHITPIILTVPDPITIIRLSLGKNYLGEAVKNITILDHNGAQIGSFAANSSNTYDLVEYGIFENGLFRTYAGKTFTARFESQNAIVESKFTIPTISKYAVHTLPAIDVPYLFYDDFAGIKEDFAKDDHNEASLNSANGMLFSTAVSGWNGAHIKGVAGKCVRINTRHESTGGSTRSTGRLDTPAMKGLKSGASVTLKVEFDMGSYIRQSGYDHNSEIYCIAGTTTVSEASAINGWSERVAFGSPDNDLNRIPPMLEKHCWSSGHIAPKYGNDSFGDTFPTYSFTASGCTRATRMTLVPGTNQTQAWLMGNVHYYLYIDNIRVSIAQ